MKTEVINLLNKLNKDFYSQTSEDFSDSRKYFWSGWEKILKYINKGESFWDIGCGNARFAEFLLKNLPQDFYYYGTDLSKELIKIGESILSKTQLKYKLKADNILEFNSPDQKFDVIVSFGVLHHIPSYENREKFFNFVNSNLNPGGIFVITAWDFMNHERFREKIASADEIKKLGLNQNDLEGNDYILDWKRGDRALRYCHHTNHEEALKLIKKSNFTLLENFTADGKTNDINQYYVLTSKPV